MIKCKNCNRKDEPDESGNCPGCGHDMATGRIIWRKSDRVVFGIIAACVLIIATVVVWTVIAMFRYAPTP